MFTGVEVFKNIFWNTDSVHRNIGIEGELKFNRLRPFIDVERHSVHLNCACDTRFVGARTLHVLVIISNRMAPIVWVGSCE